MGCKNLLPHFSPISSLPFPSLSPNFCGAQCKKPSPPLLPPATPLPHCLSSPCSCLSSLATAAAAAPPCCLSFLPSPPCCHSSPLPPCRHLLVPASPLSPQPRPPLLLAASPPYNLITVRLSVKIITSFSPVPLSLAAAITFSFNLSLTTSITDVSSPPPAASKDLRRLLDEGN